MQKVSYSDSKILFLAMKVSYNFFSYLKKSLETLKCAITAPRQIEFLANVSLLSVGTSSKAFCLKECSVLQYVYGVKIISQTCLQPEDIQGKRLNSRVFLKYLCFLYAHMEFLMQWFAQSNEWPLRINRPLVLNTIKSRKYLIIAVSYLATRWIFLRYLSDSFKRMYLFCFN